MTSDPTLGLHSLATMARLLGRSQPLRGVLEVASEGARLSLNAATVSISRYDTDDASLHTLINVGDLADVRAALARGRDLSRHSVAGAAGGPGVRRHPDRQRRRSALRPAGARPVAPTREGIVGHRGRHRGRAGLGRVLRHAPPGAPPFGDRSVDYVEVLVALLGGAMSRALREADLVEEARH